MLGNTGPLEEWVRRYRPDRFVELAVRFWVSKLDEASWQAPSVHELDMSNQPEYEVRSAQVPESGGVEVVYRHTYATDVTDLVGVFPPAS